MPACRNPNHEKYAIGLSRGLTQLEAYQRAGYKGGRAAACALAARLPIRTRVKELVDEALRLDEGIRVARNQSIEEGGPVTVSKEWFTVEVLKNLDSARGQGNIPAANKALEMLGRVHGLTTGGEVGAPKKEPNKGAPDGSQSAPTVNIQVLNQVLGRHGGATGGTPTDGAISLTEVTSDPGRAISDDRSEQNARSLDGLARVLGEAILEPLEGECE